VHVPNANEFVFLGVKEKFGIFEFSLIRGLFKVQIELIWVIADDVFCQGGFATLSRPATI